MDNEKLEGGGKPKYSIIVPVYNASRFLDDCIQSVLNQTASNWELICVDDHSTDNSLEILEKYSRSDMRIKVFQTKRNGGSAAARNEGIKHSTGRYLSFLDADDMYLCDYLEHMNRFLLQSGPFVFSSYYRLASKSKTIWRVRTKQNIKGCYTGDDISVFVMFDTDVFGRPLFDTSLIMNEDSMYWIELLKKCEWAYGNPEALAIYRIVKKSKSKSKIKSAKYMWFIYRKKCHLPLFTSLWYLLRMTLYSVNKYKNVR